jgi:hypothetical protein
MNKDQFALKGGKTFNFIKKRALWLFVAILGVLIMPFVALYQLFILLRQSYPSLKEGLLSLGMVLIAAFSYLPEFISKLQKKKTVSSKT